MTQGTLTYRPDAAGAIALLGDCEVGRINQHGFEVRKYASWISYLPTPAGGRMLGPVAVKDVGTAQSALGKSVREWLARAGVERRATA